MSPEAQRIAIAKACGKTGEMDGRFLPNYLSDLNAMHEAEETLTFTQRENYSNALNEVLDVGYCGEMDAIEAFAFLHATPAQRAEAFLRSLNLFE